MSRKHYTLDECKAFSFFVMYHGTRLECEPAKSVIEEGQPLPIEVELPNFTPMFGGWQQVPGTDCLTQGRGELTKRVLDYVNTWVQDEHLSLVTQLKALAAFLNHYPPCAE